MPVMPRRCAPHAARTFWRHAGSSNPRSNRWPKEKGSTTFCEQKVAKKRCYFGPVPFHRHRPKVIKVFCAVFFQKSGRFPSHGANATARHVKKILQSDWLREVLSWLAAHYLLLVAKTLRWRISGEAQLQEMATGAPMIVVFWHEAIPSMPIFWQQVKRRGVGRPAVALASRHRGGRP